MTDQVGQKLWNYHLLRLLGNGAFAEVYLGKHICLETQVAIKILKMRLAATEIDEFLAEVPGLVSLAHPNIVRVLELGIEDDMPFLVMEYVSGGTLRQRYSPGSMLSSSAILSYVKHIAPALQYLHNK